jgi:hypothetical protein
MDPVKMKFALAVFFSLGLAAAEPAFAQSSVSSIELSAKVDGVRGRCGLGLLARTTGSQTCQSFRDYGSRMQCVATDLSNEGLISASPVLIEVASCYRALGDALVAGRGANNDQINALEDVCRNLRHQTVVPRTPTARDLSVFASDVLMPGFSRRTVAVPTINPLMGIRLHDLPDCSVALMVPPGPPSTAGTLPASRVSGGDSGAVTSSIQSPRLANTSYIGVESSPLAPLQDAPTGLTEGKASGADLRSVAAPKATVPSDERSGANKLVEDAVDRTVGKSKARVSVADVNGLASISESAVIHALPVVTTAGRKTTRRTTAREERGPVGYGGATAADGGSKTRTVAVPPAVPDSPLGARSSSSNGSNTGYSALSPPGLPLTGPPLRPQTAGAVR